MVRTSWFWLRRTKKSCDVVHTRMKAFTRMPEGPLLSAPVLAWFVASSTIQGLACKCNQHWLGCVPGVMQGTGVVMQTLKTCACCCTKAPACTSRNNKTTSYIVGLWYAHMCTTCHVKLIAAISLSPSAKTVSACCGLICRQAR